MGEMVNVRKTMSSLMLSGHGARADQSSSHSKGTEIVKPAWQELAGKTIKNYQGYSISFKTMGDRLICTVEKDNVIRENVPFVVLADYLGESKQIENSHLLTFDANSRHVILGEWGLKGGMKGKQKDDEISLSEVEMHFNEAYEKDNKEEIVLYLEKLGQKYLEVKNFIRAAHLFSSATAAAMQYKFKDKVPLLWKKMEEVEK